MISQYFKTPDHPLVFYLKWAVYFALGCFLLVVFWNEGREELLNNYQRAFSYLINPADSSDPYSSNSLFLARSFTLTGMLVFGAFIYFVIGWVMKRHMQNARLGVGIIYENGFFTLLPSGLKVPANSVRRFKYTSDIIKSKNSRSFSFSFYLKLKDNCTIWVGNAREGFFYNFRNLNKQREIALVQFKNMVEKFEHLLTDESNENKFSVSRSSTVISPTASSEFRNWKILEETNRWGVLFLEPFNPFSWCIRICAFIMLICLLSFGVCFAIDEWNPFYDNHMLEALVYIVCISFFTLLSAFIFLCPGRQILWFETNQAVNCRAIKLFGLIPLYVQTNEVINRSNFKHAEWEYDNGMIFLFFFGRAPKPAQSAGVCMFDQNIFGIMDDILLLQKLYEQRVKPNA